MTKEAQLKRKATTTIRHLEALLKLIHTLATGKPVCRTGSALKSSQAGLRTPAPKVRSKRKKSIKRNQLPRNVQDEQKTTTRPYGISPETESSWPECLESGRIGFL
jgi:hypothetical protein